MDRQDWTVPQSTDGAGAALVGKMSKFHSIGPRNSRVSRPCYAAACAFSSFLDGSVQFTLERQRKVLMRGYNRPGTAEARQDG
jgi:hypothetical protein